MKSKTESGLNFKDITSEVYRSYLWASGAKITIYHPLLLNVSDNGHRVLDEAGVSHYIPNGWIHLSWEVFDGENNFSF